MRVLPVIDLLNGIVVHGVAGRRDEYRPIRSQLTTSSDAVGIANAIRATFGLHRLYVADLDGILRQQPNLVLFERLVEEGFELLVDAGFRHLDDVHPVRDAGITRLIVGLESCRSPDDLQSIAASGIEVTFSLDLQRATPRHSPNSQGWSNQPETIIRQVAEVGVHSILVLDLADVGMGTGGSTDRLCRELRATYPSMKLLTGGGVRNVSDLQRFAAIGVDEVLVASAIHDGRLTPADIGQSN